MTGMPLRAPAPRRLRFRLPASRGGLAWLAVLVILGALTQAATATRAELRALEAQNDALRRELAYLNSDAYIGAKARGLRTLGQHGERLLIIPPGAEAPVRADLLPPPPAPKPLLEQWLDLFFGR
jgi:hypothetical protein